MRKSDIAALQMDKQFEDPLFQSDVEDHTKRNTIYV